MALFLNGGGSANQMQATYAVFKQCVDIAKPLLYIPIAKETERHPSCFDWVSQELAPFGFCNIKMVHSAVEIAHQNLRAYGAVFVGGGNTYKLLKELKEAVNGQGVSAADNIKAYVASGGTLLGGSAGAIIFGKNIDTCRHADENNVNLIDTSGFNMAFGAGIGAHYTNRPPAKTKAQEANYTALSYQMPIVALPEECTLYVDKNVVRVLGDRDWYLFKSGKRIAIESNLFYAPDVFTALVEK